MTTAGRGRSLLVVEDEEITREGLAYILRREGYQVTVAADGQAALDVLRAGPAPDLIILDMLLPVLDGWVFLKLLAREERLSGVPILVATATTLNREWAEAHGCAGFIRKPFTTADLLEEVRRCLR